MPIFYLDSGSIDNLEISSSLLVSGSFTLSGSMNSQGGLTGSLLGTASLATTASYYELVTGSAGTDFNIVATLSGSIINIPTASATNTGLVTNTDQTIAGSKTLSGTLILSGARFNNNLQNITENLGEFGSITIGNFNQIDAPLNPTIIAGRSFTSLQLGDIDRTVTEANSGTHNLISQVAIRRLKVTDGGGTGITQNFASLYVEGPATGSASTNGSIQNNYSIWVDSGSVRFDGDLIMSGSNILATGSISATQGFTGSLLGTASFATTASYVLGGSSNITVQDEGGAGFSVGTLNFVGDGVTAADAGGGVATITIPGGSGQTFPYTGSAIISGSLIVTGSTSSTEGFTGSLLGTASWAENSITASFVTLAQTASYVLQAVSASFATNASTASFVTLAQTASYVETAQTASYVLQAVSASFATNASTASFVTLAETASYVETAQTASYVTGSIFTSTNPALSASYAVTASYVEGGGGGGTTFLISATGISIADPTSAEDITLLYTSGSVVIQGVEGVVRGTATPSVTVTLRYDTDRSATGTAIVSAQSVTSTTTGNLLTLTGNTTVPAGNFVWLETTATGGTVNELFIGLIY